MRQFQIVNGNLDNDLTNDDLLIISELGKIFEVNDKVLSSFSNKFNSPDFSIDVITEPSYDLRQDTSSENIQELQVLNVINQLQSSNLFFHAITYLIIIKILLISKKRKLSSTR